MRLLPIGLSVALLLLLSREAGAAQTLTVGPGKMFATPCAAVAVAQAGDTIAVDAGSYDGDHCGWTTDNLTLQAVGGRAKIDANKSGANVTGDKGIFVVGAAHATIDGFELSGATATAKNGAGIRHEGASLTVRNCYFHDNEDGVLGFPATAGVGELRIESSEFSNNGFGDGQSHNMYLGLYSKFTLIGSYSHGAKVGHLVKSRALENDILYNRLTDEEGTTASYELNLPNGGLSFVIGNLIEQSAASENSGIIDFGSEGQNADNHLYVVNNTIVNDKGSGLLVQTALAEPALIMNNILTGGGTITNQATAKLTTNFSEGDPLLVAPATFDYHLQASSPCRDTGTDPASVLAMIAPTSEYEHPLQTKPRSSLGTIDIGAYEFGNPGMVSVDAGTSGGDGGGGASTSRADSGADDAGDSADPSSGSDSGCALSGPSSTPTPLAAAGLLVLAVLARRRPRR